jgi:hypothetical protein
VAMPGLKSMPHRICKEILWQIGHSFQHTLGILMKSC